MSDVPGAGGSYDPTAPPPPQPGWGPPPPMPAPGPDQPPPPPQPGWGPPPPIPADAGGAGQVPPSPQPGWGPSPAPPPIPADAGGAGQVPPSPQPGWGPSPAPPPIPADAGGAGQVPPSAQPGWGPASSGAAPGGEGQGPPPPAAAPPPMPAPGPDQGPPPSQAGWGAPPAAAAPPPIAGDAGGPAQAPPGAPQRAILHSTEQTRTYPCSSCGGQLVFHIASQKLRCPHCGNTQDIVEDAGRVTEEQDFRGTVSALRSFAATQTAAPPQLSGEKEVVCQSCGGHTTFTGTLTATRCPYCATPIQRDDVHDAPARLPVNGVVPFQVDEAKARELVESWITRRRFAPTEFKKYKQTGSFSSVYASYFTYDAEITTNYEGQRGEHYTVTVGSGDNQRTETRTRWHGVAGQVHDSFDDVAILANEGFDRAKVEQLEPWPTQAAKPFSAEYIAGHLCKTYDRDVEACYPQAERIMDSTIDLTIRRDIGGDEQRVTARQKYVQRLTFKHLLLPIWLLTVIYAGRPFQVCINGVTGEVQGQRPWSKAKIITAIVVAVVVLAVLIAVWQAAGGGG